MGVAAAAIAAVVVAIALAGGGDDPQSAATTTPKKSQGSSSTAQQPAAPEAAEQPATTPPSPPPSTATAGTSSPSALNLQGDRLLKAGSYAGAIPILQRSVKGFQDSGTTDNINYAYALYNLAIAHMRSGDPAAAIPLLEQRLEIPNQQPLVRRTLAEAQAQANGDTGANGKKPKVKTGAED